MIFSMNRSAAAGLATAATLALTLAAPGCGGSGQDSSEAVVVPAPDAALPTPGAAAAPAGGAPAAPGGAAPTAATPAAASTSAAPSGAAAGKSEGWGTFKGQVVFGGTPPGAENLIDKGKAPKDPEVCAKDAPIKVERLIVDGSTKGVKNALVYFPKAKPVNDEAKAAAAKAEVTFDQNKCVFEPHVLAVMAGEKITLKSSDPVNHNVNAKLQKNSPFNSILAAGQSIPFTPSTGERSPVPVTCDIHPWMQAYWMVVDSPYFAVTDEKGNFEIKNLPAGPQQVVVWQEAVKFVTPPAGETVTIVAGTGAAPKTFTIDPSTVKSAK